MNQLKIITGNLFNSKSQTLVNTVNTVGVMGAGIALEFKYRYPEMFEQYVEICNKKLLTIGKLWLYKGTEKWILNFPTKIDWKNDSKEEYLKSGLQKFLDTYKSKNITSIAFPVLGASNGNLSENIALEIMQSYLSNCEIPIEIYKFDPQASDDLYDKLKHLLIDLECKKASKLTHIPPKYMKLLLNTLKDESVRNMRSLVKIKGLGMNSMSKLYEFLNNSNLDR